ncbi:MAG: manganese efflux pump MntP family protein [Candidatus Anaerobiospirillum merdipullorum]|uniref:Putative manganese efflux pump MntP n=1 Tax=Candidatus Anaerobiospirillum merdipullorum TaxID=2838450 RepID=A0A9E2KLF8_9GAMM|nr:manganese efflux pump MntP family protein [Candidatus Anaerobiospirillum merdipullorum]
MSIIEAFFMAVALSVDALVCAVICGKRRLAPGARLSQGFKLTLSFGLFQALMPILGFMAGKGVVDLIKHFDHWVAFALLALVAGKMLKDAILGEGEEPVCAISWWAILTLALATSIDALALGFSLGLIYSSISLFALITGLTCALLTALGFCAGQWLSSFGRLNRLLNAAGGIVLLTIGLRILSDHQVFA